jgi:branched-chain amino acid transport system ATP-binding protein
VLLDEPSEGLAPVIVDDMAKAIGELKREGLTILLSEQNLRFAAGITDRVDIESGKPADDDIHQDDDAH